MNPVRYMPKNVFARYVLIGGTAYFVEMGTLYALRYVMHLSPVRAAAISFWIGFVVAFLLQKLITFRNYERHAHAVARQVVFYALLTGWNYFFTLVLVKLLADHVSVLIVRTGAIAITTSWNFFVYKRFFKTGGEVPPA